MYNQAIIEKELRHIADTLVLKGSLVDCPGLVYGKTGIAIFFFHYVQHTGNELYEDYAMDLIGEMQSQIHNNSPANYESGLAGIGVGMDYLTGNHFLSADNDFFEDIDKRMYRAVMYDPWPDFSLYNGLTGYGRYWLMRLRRQALLEQARECLSHIAACIEEKFSDIPAKDKTDVYCFLHDWQDISGNMTRMYQSSRYFNYTPPDATVVALEQIPDLDMEKPPVNMGLLTGYAGEGMLRLNVLEPTNTLWMNLL